MWSPDGERIVFSRTGRRFRDFVMMAGRSNVEQFTRNDATTSATLAAHASTSCMSNVNGNWDLYACPRMG